MSNSITLIKRYTQIILANDDLFLMTQSLSSEKNIKNKA